MNIRKLKCTAILLCSFAICTNVSAWNVKVINNLSSPINVILDLALCGDQKATIAAKDEYAFNTVICCSKMLSIENTFNGRKGFVTPPSTGLGVSCKSYTVNINSQSTNGFNTTIQ
jgi:hypothetical protein